MMLVIPAQSTFFILPVFLLHIVYASAHETTSSASSIIQSPSTISQEFQNGQEEILVTISDKGYKRHKRFVTEAIRRVKQLTKFNKGVAISNTFRELRKSAVRSVLVLGAGMAAFNIVDKKINDRLDKKNKELDKVEKKSKVQVVAHHPDSLSAASFSHNSTVLNLALLNSTLLNSTAMHHHEENGPVFDPGKVTLQIPDSLFGPAFELANGVSQVFGTLVTNTGHRVARLISAVRPTFREARTEKTRKRETEEGTTISTSDFSENISISSTTPVKNSYTALRV